MVYSYNPFNLIVNSRFQELGKSTVRHAANVAARADAWAGENPYQAAIAGAAIGAATTFVFNKVLAIKGTIAVASYIYGTGKGALAGYSYPAARRSSVHAWRAASHGVVKVDAAVRAASGQVKTHASNYFRRHGPKLA